MSDSVDPVCPCDAFEHPRIIANPPGLTSITYRVGEYPEFREAMLRARRGERALASWTPSASGDLALQLLEWWAYLADVLTFYNERALHETLLRTALLPEDIRRIVRLLGYRPRPGIGATGVVAAMADSPRPFTLPAGFAIQGPGGRGTSPQVFEIDEDIEVGLLGRPLPASARLPSLGTASGWQGHAARDVDGQLLNALPARAKQDPSLPLTAGSECVAAVRGVVTSVKANDVVLFLKHDWDGEPSGYALASVNQIEPTRDALGRAVTVLKLHPGHDLVGNPQRHEYKLLKATKLAHLWLYHERYPGMRTPSIGGLIAQAAESFFDPAGLFSGGVSKEPPQDPHALTSLAVPVPAGRLPEGAAHLEAITRGISPGDPVLFEQKLVAPGLPGLFAEMIAPVLPLDELKERLQARTLLAKVTSYSELIWYANPPEADRIGQGPPIGPPDQGLLSGGASPIPIPHSKITFQDPLGIASAMSVDDLFIGSVVVHYGWQEVGPLVSADIETAPTTKPEVPATQELPADAPLPVLIEDATGAGVPGRVGETNGEGPQLVPPLRALLNLLPVSRGQTVRNEVLGSGDPILINQEFVLGQAPLTYLTDTGPRSRNGYRSTLRIWVSGIEWHEATSFYEQSADARVFVTREDDEQRTHVRFGDGELGARLPKGIDNVIATYRKGSGAEVPAVGTLKTILKPMAGLQEIRNPIAPGGGADPDPPEQIRRYAPRSVLTFGRAISGDDYETLAAQTPGVQRARARWTWDAASQRTLVKVFVGDDDGAVAAARNALRAFADPNRPVLVQLAAPVLADLTFTLEVDPDHLPEDVAAAVRARLLDPTCEPFGSDVVRIDDVVYDSQIYDVCMAAPGVVAVHGLAFRTLVSTPGTRRFRPPGFGPLHPIWDVELTRDVLELSIGERHAPGEGRFYLLQGDRLHITTEVGRHGR